MKESKRKKGAEIERGGGKRDTKGIKRETEKERGNSVERQCSQN